jgi:hypothetical protein
MFKIFPIILLFISCAKSQNKFDTSKTMIYYYPENIETYSRKNSDDIINSKKSYKYYSEDILSPLFYDTIDSLVTFNNLQKKAWKGFEPDFVIKLNNNKEDIYISIDYFGKYNTSFSSLKDSVYFTNGYLVKVLELYIKGLKEERKKCGGVNP